MKNSLNRINADLRCIWMSAGVINYKLCDRRFLCETCEFDTVMRGMLPQKNQKDEFNYTKTKEENSNTTQTTSNLINQYLFSMFSDCKIHLDRYYHPSHFWYKIESENTVSVGIDKPLIKIIEPINEIILPKVGEMYFKDKLIVLISRKGKTFQLNTPISGKVIEINNVFQQKGFRQILQDDTYFFKMSEMGIKQNVQHLCDDLQGLQSFTTNIDLLRNYLIRSYQQKQPPNIGVTIADGGNFHTELEKIIGLEDYQKLLKQLFNS